MEKIAFNHGDKIGFAVFFIMLICWSTYALNIIIKEEKMNTVYALIKDRTFSYSITVRDSKHDFYKCNISYMVEGNQYTALVELENANVGEYTVLKVDRQNPTVFQLAANRKLIIFVEVVLISATVGMGIIVIPNKKNEEEEIIS